MRASERLTRAKAKYCLLTERDAVLSCEEGTFGSGKVGKGPSSSLSRLSLVPPGRRVDPPRRWLLAFR